jgi:hypothetical protein
MSDEIGSLRNPVMVDQDPGRPMPMEWQTYSDQLQSDWFALLARDPEEDEVQRFLELHPALVPGGSGDIGPGGHHGSDLHIMFRQPRLKGAGRDFSPDFMWVTRSSTLITPILIEIEKPSKRWFGRSGRPTRHFEEAHDQLRDWRTWFSADGNARTFRDQYLFLDPWQDRALEPQYVLIYGRESEFRLGGGHSNPDALNRKRAQLRGPDETLRTFDSLRPRFDHSSSITATMRATGPEAFALSPVYRTSPYLLGGMLKLSNFDEALERTKMLPDERRQYLKERWDHWEQLSIEEAQSGRRWAHQAGWE